MTTTQFLPHEPKQLMHRSDSMKSILRVSPRDYINQRNQENFTILAGTQKSDNNYTQTPLNTSPTRLDRHSVPIGLTPTLFKVNVRGIASSPRRQSKPCIPSTQYTILREPSSRIDWRPIGIISSQSNEANQEVAPAADTPRGSGVLPDDGTHGSFPPGNRCSTRALVR
jgi:hypothetical protein